MAIRPVFISRSTSPFVEEINCEFKWNGGFAVSQKRKNIKALHDEFRKKFPNSNLLEISTKSENELGVALSAHNLKKLVSSIQRNISVECIYHSSKVFTDSGPHTEIYDMPPIKSKKYLKSIISGTLCAFQFEEKDYPLIPTTAFYDWIYLNALLENKELIEPLLKYNAFTDIAHNPEKSVACQARTVALFVSLYKLNLLDIIKDFDKFIEIAY